jgi:hypothetical protein
MSDRDWCDRALFAKVKRVLIHYAVQRHALLAHRPLRDNSLLTKEIQ